MSASLWVKTSAVVNELSSPPPFKKTTFVFFESLPVRGIRVSRMINFCLLLFRFASAESGRLRRLRRRPVVVVPQLRRRKQNPPTKTFQFVRLVPSFFAKKSFLRKKKVFFCNEQNFYFLSTISQQRNMEPELNSIKLLIFLNYSSVL